MPALARLPAVRPEDDDGARRPLRGRLAAVRAAQAKRVYAPPPELSREELVLLARLEGRPLPRGQALADLLGVSPTAAWRLVRRLRQQGALGFVSTARIRADACQCVTLLKVQWTQTSNLDALDAHLRADPAIVTADRVTGASDYRIVSRHADYQAANAWTRALAAHVNVAHAASRFCTTVYDRPNYAAARLAADTRNGELRL